MSAYTEEAPIHLTWSEKVSGFFGLVLATGLLAVLAVPVATAAESVWWEGEAPEETNFPPRNKCGTILQ